MVSKDLVEIGSATAKGGFANERAIRDKFNNWKKDKEAQIWLQIMGYNIKEIESVEAVQIPPRGQKADVQLKIMITIGKIIKVENLSLKKANSDADYNQIDKRWVDAYQKLWNFDDDVKLGLKLFTGEIKPTPKYVGNIKLRDKRRAFLDELPTKLRNKIIDFFRNNKILVVTDILKGRGSLSADWVLVTRYDKNTDTTKWILKDINTVMNFFGEGEVRLSPRGSLYIGKITMQRKGGDAGRPTANMLQFKIKPCQLFELSQHTL